MQGLSRRRLLCLALGAGGAVGIERIWSLRRRERFYEVSRTTFALGSEVTVTALHASHSQAEQAVNAAFAELEQIESLLSIYQSESQVSRLNRDGRLARPHEHLLAVLRHSQDLSHRSHGAFDVTVQPLWQLFSDSKRNGRLPSDAEVAAAARLVGYRQLRVARSEVSLARPGAAITLNGIAQGYAADRVAAVLRQHGIEHALANIGELRPLGESPGGDPWTVGIQHPRRPDAYMALARLDGRALATSGDYATTFSEDYRHHHLFDPRRGSSPAELSSVSVVAPTAIAADALSTAVFVLGSKRGMELVRSTIGADAFLVRKDGRTLASDGFPLVEGGVS